jgi:O-antigen/teichoic acid export membrane protein
MHKTNTKNKIVKNFLSTGFASLIGQLFTFLITAYYANIIGAKYYGEVSLAQSIWLYFSMVVLFGIQTYGTRIVATNKDKLKEYIDGLVSFRIAVSFICFLCIILIAFLSNESYNFKVILILFGLSLFPMAFNIDWVYNGIEEMQHNAVYILIKNIIPCVILLIFFRISHNLYLIPLAFFIGMLLASLYYLIYLHKKLRIHFKFTLNCGAYKIYFKAGLPFLLSNLLAMVNGNVDKIIMGFTIDKAQLGIYMAAYAFINFLISFSGLIFNPIFPSLIRAYNNGEKDKLASLGRNISKVITMLVLPITFGGIILSKDIIGFFFKSEEYKSGYIPFCILLIYIFVIYIREIFAYQLNAFNMEKKYMKIVFVSASLNLILNLIAIPYYGMIGAAIVTLLTEFINLIFMRHYAIKVIHTPILRNISVVFIPTVVMSLWVYLLKYYNINLILNIVSAIVIYFILLLIFRVLSIKAITNMVKGRNI